MNLNMMKQWKMSNKKIRVGSLLILIFFIYRIKKFTNRDRSVIINKVG